MMMRRRPHLKSCLESSPMPTPFMLLAVTAALGGAFAQSAPRIEAVDEPPELTGTPTEFKKPPEILQQMADVYASKDDPDKARAAVETITRLLRENSNYSDGYFTRAIFNYCVLKSADVDDALRDIDAAIATHPSQEVSPPSFSLTDHYSLKANIEFVAGRHKQAMNDLEKGLLEDIENAESLFAPSGSPNSTARNSCEWQLSDLDRLVGESPADYRTLVFRGLYYFSLVAVNVKYSKSASDDFRSATTINPQSAQAYYFLGRICSRNAFFPSLTGISQEKSHKSAIQAYDKAVELDPNLWPAFLERANSRYQLKQYKLAISDFDRVLELDPENSGAYHDRALAKLNTDQYRPAILDFDEAIRRRSPDDMNLWAMYENRADCYIKLTEYRAAVADLTVAIRLQLRFQGFLFDLRQFRALYPEYNQVSDRDFILKLNKLFWPQYAYEVLAKQLSENKNEWAIDVLDELYEKRGDAYLNLRDFRRGTRDFKRIFDGIPLFADVVDRWRLIQADPNGNELYIDVKTVEFADPGPSRLWLKAIRKDETYTVQGYEIDCKLHQFKLATTVLYDSNHAVLRRSESDVGWERVIPDTVGELIFTGTCAGVQN
jgi:tetratricopeptide (TPR) repeat protein